MKQSTIYTHDEAAKILELFENVLIKNGIVLPSPEDDEKDKDNKAALYGSVYSDLLDEVEDLIIDITARCKDGNDVITNEFSGQW